MFARVASHLSPLTPPIGDLRGSARRSVGDLFRELSGLLDPARHLLLGRHGCDLLGPGIIKLRWCSLGRRSDQHKLIFLIFWLIGLAVRPRGGRWYYW